MAHECPACGQMCYCDGEDTYLGEGDEDCVHECQEDGEEEDEDDG